MNRSTRAVTAVMVTLLGTAPAQAQDGGQVNIICSVQAEWCNLIQTVYARTTGVKVDMSLKGSGEALAQVVTETADPKTDIWFGGTGDPQLQTAEQDLSLAYKSPSLSHLHPWAQQQAARSQYKTVGAYSGPLGFGYNIELLAKRKLQALKGEIQVAIPASSDTAHTMVATLVQLMGEAKAFEYMKGLHKNVNQCTRSGTGPIKSVARGQTTTSISFVHDGPGQKMQGFPVETIAPSDDPGAEIGLMSLIKGARNLEAAKKFSKWALTGAAQDLGAAAKQFQLPSAKSAKVDPRVPDFKKIKFIDYDYAKYGASAERRRLIGKWEEEVNSLPR